MLGTERTMIKERYSFLIMHNDVRKSKRLRDYISEFYPKNFIYEADNFLDGLSLAFNKKPHIALVDLTTRDFQRSSSIEVLSQLHDKMPIIILCNSDEKHLALEAVVRGADNYIVMDDAYSARNFEKTISSFLGNYNPITYIRKFYSKDHNTLSVDDYKTYGYLS